ncbi:MAG: HlyD family efflux transporter periplasmic adaptor subunit [Caldilinea sp. CFX5]|nr:HlyD family efflux transporter periplasmic adaptor subunit [Caldilinea sp. CFX5]
MQRRNRRWYQRRWLWWLLGLGALLTVFYLLNNRFLWVPLPWQTPGQEIMVDGQPPDIPLIETVPVEPASDFIRNVTESGKLEFRTINEIKAPFESTVATVAVEVGAVITAGQTLLTLNTDKLQEEFNRAWLDLTQKRQALTDLVAQSSSTAVMEAKAELLAAQEELEKLTDGPAATERQGALLAISEAKVAYEELLASNDPNSKKVRDARFALVRAEREVQRAQTAYNAVAWRGDIAASQEAAALQTATEGHEQQKAAYDEAVKPPTELQLQKAQNAIAQAQNNYDKLFTATPSLLEQAKVKVARAEEKVKSIENGPPPLKVQEAEGQVVEALNRLEGLRNKLNNAGALHAPFDGQVVKLSAKPGQAVKEGDTLAVVVIPDQFKLTLAISELSILRIERGMPVEITLDVLPEESFTGTVATIAPPTVQTEGDTTSGGGGGGGQFTTYGVTVAMGDDTRNQRLLGGMSARATFVGSNQLPANAWLVPANAITEQNGDIGTIQLMRGETPTPLEVQVTELTHGESVVIVSEELQVGDMVVGSMASFLDQQQPQFFGP